MGKQRVAICAAACNGLKASLVKRLFGLGLELGKHDDVQYLPILVPRMHGPTCLNAAIHMAMEALSDAGPDERLTHILWMDKDTMLTGAQAFRLLDAVDPRHPAVFAFDHTAMVMFRPRDQRGELVRVQSAGFAAAAFDADLFRELREPWFRWQKTDTVRAEDNYLCQFIEQGVPVYCDLGVRPAYVTWPVLREPETAVPA